MYTSRLLSLGVPYCEVPVWIFADWFECAQFEEIQQFTQLSAGNSLLGDLQGQGPHTSVMSWSPTPGSANMDKCSPTAGVFY